MQALGAVGALMGSFLALLRGHNIRRLPAVRCVGAGAERREGGGFCVARAYVVSPQAKKKQYVTRRFTTPRLLCSLYNPKISLHSPKEADRTRSVCDHNAGYFAGAP
jgi:hypothetical protein